jgi:ketosteroid isomerase-like protein
MSQDNVEMLRGAYAAINRRDADWLIEHSDPNIEMHMSGVAGEPVLYTGAAGIREWFRDMAESWQSFEFVPEDIRDLGDRLFASVIGRLRGRASGIDVDARQGIVIEFRNGKAATIRSYRDVADALEAAGLPERDAHADS